MTIAKAVLTQGLVFGLAVILSGSTAQADHYRRIDNHARDIEREAERAEAIVKYNFRHAPRSITQYLADELCGVARSAHRLDELTECRSNLMAVDALTSQLESQFRHVQEGVQVLREWVHGSQCSVRRFSSCFKSCRPRSADRANLASLCRRTDEIGEELCKLKEDLQIVLNEHYRSRRQSSHSRFLSPSPQPRFEPTKHAVPLGTYNHPGHNFSHRQSFSLGRSSSWGNSFSSRSGRSDSGHRSSRYSRHLDSSYIHTRIGGIGLSFRLK